MTVHGTSGAPDPFTPILKTPEMEALWAKLLASGWADKHQQRLEIDDVLKDDREFVFQASDRETHLTVRDLGNWVSVRVALVMGEDLEEAEPGGPEPAETVLFESAHISQHRLFALLHVMGIVRADDGWMAWYDTEIWE